MSASIDPIDALREAKSQAEKKALCEYMVEAGKLSRDDVSRALRLQQEQDEKERIGSLLVKLGLLSDRDVAESLSKQSGLPLIEKKEFPDDLPVDKRVSLQFLKEHQALLITEDDDQIVVVMADTGNQYVIDALRLITGKDVLPRVGVPSEIEASLQQQAERERAEAQEQDGLGLGSDALYQNDVEHLKELASEAPVIKRVNQIINQAVESGASDIHIEPFENRLVVRLRVDGMLREIDSPPASAAAALVSRVKIMANLNIAERRLPQDGRFKVRARGMEIDLRVSTVPTIHGESLVLRLLRRDALALDFAPLGFDPQLETRVLEILKQPHGIILVTGPTGSGKTTTLYAALKHLNRPELKILTVEDPVEYNIEGVNQIQVKPQIDLTFANALRSIVRQDPDVIMIGEMRDQETAQIAVQSALTGHLVLSTIHTNDAAGSITRLLDMGVEDYLLTSTINAVLAQRLVRKLCTHCREPYEPVEEMVKRWHLDRLGQGGRITLYRAVGCEHCEGVGYIGRSGIHELLVMSDPIRQLVLKHADAGQIMKQALQEGAASMFEDGLRKALAGVTTMEEVLRVTQVT
jgi:general secretion pathway protein E